MTASVDIAATVKALKSAFRQRYQADVDSGRLKSVFLIGSCAGDTKTLDDPYQDFDIHFLWDKADLDHDDLASFRDRLAGICDEFDKPWSTVAWSVRDRHWKLVPDPSTPINLSIHATLANRYDYQRRALLHPVLGSNMYRICEVIVGAHPGEVLTPRRPSPLEHLYSVGGAGWMLENFHRAVFLHLTEPDRQDFMPYVSGYSWNVASSVMLQYYTTQTGRVTTRRDAFKFLLEASTVPARLRSELQLLAEHKERPRVDAQLARRLMNAASSAASWMIGEIARAIDVELPTPALPATRSRDLFSEPLSAALERRVRLRELHLDFDPGDDFVAAMSATVQRVRAEHPNATTRELPEFIRWVVEDDLDEATKIYLWSPFNALRFRLSDDFAFARGAPSLQSAVWGWESGCQALLQRLHEMYVAGRGATTASELSARAFSIIAQQQLEACGLRTPAPTGTFFDRVRYLAARTEPHSVALSNLTIGAA